MEVDRFWSRKGYTWTSFMFYLNRYSTLLAHIPVLMEYFWVSYEEPDDRYIVSVIVVHIGRCLTARPVDVCTTAKYRYIIL